MSSLQERDAMLKFMGNIFGQAKKIDSDVVERSNNLNPIHHHVQHAFERELRAPRPGPVVIPPTPEEIAATGLIPPPVPSGYMPGALPIAQPVPDVVPPVQAAHPSTVGTSYPLMEDRVTPHPLNEDSGFIFTPPPTLPSFPYPSETPRAIIGHTQYTPNPQDSNLEILRLLNTILDKLKIIELQNEQTTPRKPKAARTVLRRSTKDK